MEQDPLMYSIIINEAVLSYQYFGTVRWINIWKTWLGHEIFKIVFIFFDQESQQKWNPFLLEIEEIRIVFVCVRRVKATKIGKSRSNYSFLLLFLSLIRKGLRRKMYELRSELRKFNTKSLDTGNFLRKLWIKCHRLGSMPEKAVQKMLYFGKRSWLSGLWWGQFLCHRRGWRQTLSRLETKTQWPS